MLFILSISINFNEDQGIGSITSRLLLGNKGKNKKKFDEFFPRIKNYNDIEEVKRKWYCKEPYKARLYEKYLKHESFRNLVDIVIKDLNKTRFLQTYEGIKKISKSHYSLLVKYVQILKNAMLDAYHNKEACILEINGFTGAGKSRYARSVVRFYAKNIAKKNYYVHGDFNDLNNDFYVNLGFDNSEPFHVYVTYRTSETEDIIKNHFKPGDWIFQDEMPIQMGEKSRTTKNDLINIIKVASRKKMINMIFVTPDIIELENVDYYVTIMGINKPKKLTLSFFSTDSKNYIGTSILTVNEDPELTVYYEEISDVRKTQLMEDGGFAGVGFDKEERDRLAGLLIERIKEDNYPIRYQRDVEVKALEVADVVNCKWKAIVITHVYNIIRSGQKLEKEKERKEQETIRDTNRIKIEQLKEGINVDDFIDEKTDEFMYDEKEILEKYGNKRDVKIYLESISKSNEIIAADHDLTDPSSVTKIRNKIGLWIAQEVGRVYEPYLATQYRKMEGVKEVIHDGRNKKPDIIVFFEDGRVWVISVKCFNVNRPSINLSRDELSPEIFFALKYKKQHPEANVMMFNHIRNLYNNLVQEIPIDFNNPLETYNIPMREIKGK